MTAQFDTQLPQGFSVFQPMLGAPLQFFPALGTKELDDMLDAYVVGPASVKEKRATVSVDFLDYAQRTGQTFKFYAVPGLMAPVESPTMASPLQASTSASSINASPLASSWDWSAVSAPTPSARPAKAARTASTASSRRSAPTDFSHLPGMKILTKEGLDVTNSASRGSKTKEQRDHAHLMRIIKACDSCKKKKIRCDPSHKKRSVTTQPAKVTKKQARAPQPTVAAPQPDSFPETPTFGLDSTFTSPEFENLDVDNLMKESWEDLIQFPAEEDANYDFFLDPQGFFSQPLDQQAISSSSESPFSWSDEQFNAYTSSSDQGLIQSASTSTSPSILELDTTTLPPDLPQSPVPLNPSDQIYAQPQAGSVAMPDLFQPVSVEGSGQLCYATSLWQSPVDIAESQSSSSTDDSLSMNVSPLGGTLSVNSSPVERLESSFVAPGDLSNAPHGEQSRALQSLSESSVLQPQSDFSLSMSRSSDLDHTPGADSSGDLSRRALAHVEESEVHRSTGAPLSARTSRTQVELQQQIRVSDGRTVDSSVAADWIQDGSITGTDCIIAPRSEPATGTDCAEGGALQPPLEASSNVAGVSAFATSLQPENASAYLDTLPRMGSLSGQTSSSLVLASATLYGALDMLLAKQQRRSVTDKGRRKRSDGGSSWLGMCGKLAIIPLATVLAAGFLPGWSFVG